MAMALAAMASTNGGASSSPSALGPSSSASAAAVATAAANAAATTAQHNLSAMQAQLQALQRTNAALTADLTLKDNHLQLREQQGRAMQQRMEALERDVAAWKDRYLQQLTNPTGSGGGPGMGTGTGTSGGSSTTGGSSASNGNVLANVTAGRTTLTLAGDGEPAWVPDHTPSGKDQDAATVTALVDSLSNADRARLTALMERETTRRGGSGGSGGGGNGNWTPVHHERLAAARVTAWEEVFNDVSDELRRVVVAHLLPILREAAASPLEDQARRGRRFQCYSRTYIKRVTDVKIVCRPQHWRSRGASELELELMAAADAAAAAASATGSGTTVVATTTSSGSADGADGAGSPPTRSSSLLPPSPAMVVSSSPSYAMTIPSTAGMELLALTRRYEQEPQDKSRETYTRAMEDQDRGDNDEDADEEEEEEEEEHLFDCVTGSDAVRRHSGVLSPGSVVPHGPREIHATKAVYVSRPLFTVGNGTNNSQSANAAVSPPKGFLGSGSSSRRFSFTPAPRSSNVLPSNSRTKTMTSGSSTAVAAAIAAAANAASSDHHHPYFQRSNSSVALHDTGGDSTFGSLTGSTPSGSKETGKKIKKIMGNVMKGLHRSKHHRRNHSNGLGTIISNRPLNYPIARVSSARTVDEDDEDEGAAVAMPSACDGCGRAPVTGQRWVCRSCRAQQYDYELCEKCYGQGVHGKENEQALFERIEEIVVAKCPKLVHEPGLMKLLRLGICKANLKKYSFCLTWIADLLLCKHTRDLRARALEISLITPHVRASFVRQLTELLAKHRRDIELITEWEPVQNATETVSDATSMGHALAMAITGEDETLSPSGGSGGGGQLDTLRIWVKDIAAGTPTSTS